MVLLVALPHGPDDGFIISPLDVDVPVAKLAFPSWGVSYLQGVSVSASVNTLMAISIERCFAISFPISGTITTRQYRLIVTIIWFIALSINLPWLFVFTLRPIGIPGSIAQVKL
uniref:G-protein coupled receptors family 1 profile domain-containing protein n=1 Tax=Anopheles maculatus TaxID=74869 RepID=A0A182TAQ5_9DIPT